MMGGRQRRRKGHDYEREVATKLRAAFPSSDVRRTSQADRAANSDVIATGHPVLERLWLELQDARNPTPVAKLEQAERDVAATSGFRCGPFDTRLPVVIWHRIRERTHQVTTRLWVLDELRGTQPKWPGGAIATLDLGAFVEILRGAVGE